MHRWIAVLLMAMMSALTASAAKKDTGTTTLKDVQTAGTTDTKDNKNQQYDFILALTFLSDIISVELHPLSAFGREGFSGEMSNLKPTK